MEVIRLKYNKLTSQLKSGSLQAKALQSSVHVIVNIVFTNIIRLASNLILTRLLFPEAFGLMMIVQAFMQALIMLSDIGVNKSVINSNKINDKIFLNTAWTAKILRGLLIFTLTLVCALPMSYFYDVHELRYLIPLAGLSTFILEFSPVKAIIAERNLQIKKVVYLQLIAQLVSSTTTCVVAYFYPSVYSLLIGSILSSLFLVTAYRYLLKGPCEQFYIDKNNLNELIRFGKWLLLSSTFGLLATTSHKFALGKFLTIENFGIFAVASVLGQLPHTVSSTLSGKILLPLYSESLRAKKKKNIESSRYMLLFFSTLVCLAFLFLAPSFFGVLYDDRYAKAGYIASLIVAANFVQLFSISLSQKLIAKGDSKSFSKTIALRSLTLIFSLVLLMPIEPLSGAILAIILSNLIEYFYIIKNKELREHIVFGKEFVLTFTFFSFFTLFCIQNINVIQQF